MEKVRVEVVKVRNIPDERRVLHVVRVVNDGAEREQNQRGDTAFDAHLLDHAVEQWLGRAARQAGAIRPSPHVMRPVPNVATLESAIIQIVPFRVLQQRMRRRHYFTLEQFERAEPKMSSLRTTIPLMTLRYWSLGERSALLSTDEFFDQRMTRQKTKNKRAHGFQTILILLLVSTNCPIDGKVLCLIWVPLSIYQLST